MGVIRAGIFVEMILSPSYLPLPPLYATLKTELEDSIQRTLFIQQMRKGTCARSDTGHQR